MSHELTMNRLTGKIEMGYAAGVDRWHGLGNEWLDTDSEEQKIEKSGMAWSVMRSRVRYGEGPATRIINDQHVLYRSDTKDPLGIVGAGYEIVQPPEMIRFFRTMVESGQIKLKTAGTLYGGKKFWATASIGAIDKVVGDDVMEGFLLISSSADGSARTKVKDTTICVVCDNTLRMAMGENSFEISVSHRSVWDPVKLQERLAESASNFAVKIKAARALAKVKMTDAAAQVFLKDLLVTVAKLSEKKIDAGTSDGFNKVLALFSGEGKGATLQGRAGTAWGLVNAVTEYVDHHVPSDNGENRMDNAMWGAGDTLKTAAFDRALALVA
jgi:phage/plasmid-like protein (TIGR03299 family)